MKTCASRAGRSPSGRWPGAVFTLTMIFTTAFMTCMPGFDNPIDPQNPDAVPPTPRDLRALPVQNHNTVQLIFAYGYANATAVVIERSEDGAASFTAIDTVFFPATSAIDSFGTDDSTRYAYRIHAINTNGPSKRTGVVTCRTGVFMPGDNAGPDITVLHEGNPVAGYKRVRSDTLLLQGFARDRSGVATLTIDGDTVAIDCGGTWSYGRRLDAWRTTLTIEAYDRAETPNGSLDTVVLFYDVPNRPPRVSFELEGSSLTMRWQPCTDLDFARFAVWTSAAARIDTTIPPDAVYPSGTDTAHVFALDPAADRLFGCAIVDSAGNYVMGDNSAGHMRGGLLFRHTMVRVPAGHFRVGDSVLVHLTNAFYMDTVEIPQDSYERIIGYNPARFTGLHRPVESVSWFDAVRFCNQRSKYHGFDTVYTYERLRGDGAVNLQCRWERNGYRLPTADEWEYAARAGVRTVYLWGDSASDSLAGEYRWFSATCDSNVWLEPHAPAHGSQPVGRLRPNAWSLYDMGGNVLEWVWDYAGTAGKVNGRIDYRGPSVPVCCGEERDGPQRAAKGTTWLSSGDMPAFDALNYIPERQRSYIVGIRTVQTIPRLE